MSWFMDLLRSEGGRRNGTWGKTEMGGKTRMRGGDCGGYGLESMYVWDLGVGIWSLYSMDMVFFILALCILQ